MNLLNFLFLLALAFVLFAGWWLAKNGPGKDIDGGLDRVRFNLAYVVRPDGFLMKLWPLWSLFLVSFAVVLFLNPIKAGLIVYAISKILLAGMVGIAVHWGFRQIHPMPAAPTGIEVGTDWKCCTWIICAAEIALALVP